MIFYEKDDLKGALFHSKKYYQIDPDEKIKQDIELMEKEMEFSKGFRKIESQNLTVKYPPTLPDHIPFIILQTLEKIHSENYNFLENTSKTVVKIFDIPTFDKIIGQSSSSVVATVINNKLLIKSSEINTSSENIETVIVHEYLHLLLNRIAKERIPVWLNEGIAKFFSEGEISVYQEKKLYDSILHNGLLSFESLEDKWELNREKLSLAYIQSHSLTSFFVKRFGIKKLNKLIYLLSCGKTIDEALLLSCGLNFNQLKNLWIEYLTKLN